MAGRHHLPPNELKHRGGELPLHRGPLSSRHPIDDPRLRNRLFATVNPGTARAHHPSAILEDRIAIQLREIQSLLLDNQRLAATHVALKQELALAQQDLRHLSAAAADVKAEADNQVRDVYERSLKLDAEVRSIDAMSGVLVQVGADVQKLSVQRQELTAELQVINDELGKAKKEALQVQVVKAEIEAVQREIERGRTAIEYEKKTTAINYEQGRTLEKNMIAMAREIEKLQAELANAEKRARAAAAAAAAANPSPGYAGSYGNPDVGYGGSPYPDPYGLQQVQGGTNASPPFVSGAMTNGPYDVQRTHAYR